MPALTPSRARRSPGAGARAVLARRTTGPPATRPGEAWNRAKRLARERARPPGSPKPRSPSPTKVAAAARRAQGLAGRFSKADTDEDDSDGPPATPALRRSPLAAANGSPERRRPSSPALAPGTLTERRKRDEERRAARAAAILRGDDAAAAARPPSVAKSPLLNADDGKEDDGPAPRARFTPRPAPRAADTPASRRSTPAAPSSAASSTTATNARVAALEGTETRLLAALDAAALAAKDRLDASERERQRTLDAERALSEANALVETLRIERDRLREAHACGEASSSSSTETREKLEGQLDQALRALRAAEGRLCEADATVDALRAEMVQLRASATKDRAAARDAAESLRRARLDLDRAVAARKDAEADAASSRADADDARTASEADRRACMALEAKCRELGASDVDVAAARGPRRTVLEAVRAHREVCGLVCALVVLLDPAPLRVGIGLGALGVLAVL
jgi:hypothetical protein